MSKTVRNLLIFAVAVIVVTGLVIGAYFLLRKKVPSPPAIIPIYPNPQPLTNLRTTLISGENLNQEEKLWDSTGTFYLIVQTQDGNLVLYDYNGKAYWSCCPAGFSTIYPIVLKNQQPDGNVVLYDSTGKVGFQTKTANLPNASYPYVLSIKTYSNSQGQLLPQLQLVNNNGDVLWSSPISFK